MESFTIPMIIEMINGIGFPSAVSIILLITFREQHRMSNEMLNSFRVTLKENTEVLKNLTDKVDKL